MTDQDLQTKSDEILIKDESGQFKILSNGELKPYQEEVASIKLEAGESGLKPIPPLSGTTMIDTGLEEKMLQPPPPMLRKETASFYFHAADEEEAAKHKFDAAPFLKQKKYSLDKILIKVVDNYKLNLTVELKSRLRAAIFNFLRDRRALVDTQAILKRSSSEAGLNLEAGLADSLAEFLKEIKDKVHEQKGIVVDEQDEGLKAVLAAKGGEETIAPLPKAPLEPEPALGNLAAGATPAKATVTLVSPVDLTEKLDKEINAINNHAFRNLPRIRRPQNSGGKRVADVKKDYRLVGPVEELGTLNLETFKRLGATIAERVKKITGKINLLAEDSLVKKSQGIKAWQQSPLYRMYLAVGQSSMEYGLNVEQVIKEYSAEGRDIISVEEFEAISDLNKKLRF